MRNHSRRPGLAIETVIETLEDTGDYKAFEQSVTAGFDAQTAVERELVLRLANLLWRLRRAGAIETGLLQISSKITGDRMPEQLTALEPYNRVAAKPRRRPVQGVAASEGHAVREPGRTATSTEQGQPSLNTELAASYLRLDYFDCGAFERLSRYESVLWKQVGQLLVTLNWLRRAKPW